MILILDKLFSEGLQQRRLLPARIARKLALLALLSTLSCSNAAQPYVSEFERVANSSIVKEAPSVDEVKIDSESLVNDILRLASAPPTTLHTAFVEIDRRRQDRWGRLGFDSNYVLGRLVLILAFNDPPKGILTNQNWFNWKGRLYPPRGGPMGDYTRRISAGEAGSWPWIRAGSRWRILPFAVNQWGSSSDASLASTYGALESTMTRRSLN